MNTRGVTILELAITIPIVTALLIAGFVYVLNVLRQSDAVLERNTDEQRVRSVVRTVAKHIRSMRSGEHGEYALALAADDEIVLYGNADDDAEIERIRFRRNAGALEQGIANPSGGVYPVPDDTTVVLYDRIIDDGQPLFQYFGNDYTGTEAPLPQPVVAQTVGFVNIRIPTTIGKTSGVRVIQKGTTLRNLLFELE